MYVLFEGIDGVGKSTQIQILSEFYPGAIVTKEPGGSKFGEFLREILLEGKFDLSRRAEALLFLADRAEHYAKIVAPNKDKIVLSDRGFISGVAYAMANDENADMSELIAFNKFALNGDTPDKIVLFIADEKLVKSRLKGREAIDSIEARGLKYLLKVQENMRIIAKACKIDTLIIDANEKIEIISRKIDEFIRN